MNFGNKQSNAKLQKCLMESCNIIKVSSDTISCMVVEIDGVLPVSRSMNTGKVQPFHRLLIFVKYIYVSIKNLSSTEQFDIGTKYGFFPHARLSQI